MRLSLARTRLIFEPRDLWVGVYWDAVRDEGYGGYNVYVCLVPMLPIFMQWRYTRD
jgi:hypothetical protein